MSGPRWNRLSALLKNWIFNQEPAAEAPRKDEDENRNVDSKPAKAKVTKRNSDPSPQNFAPDIEPSKVLLRSRSEATPERSFLHSEEGARCLLQVDNGGEGDDGFLHRDGPQRRSRRRFRRINPKGERELITDGQEPAGYKVGLEAKC